jgi:hypothetical protein
VGKVTWVNRGKKGWGMGAVFYRQALCVLVIFMLFAASNAVMAVGANEFDPSVCKVDPADLVPNLVAPAVKRKAALDYPSAQENDWSEGWIKLALDIGADGLVKDVVVLDAVGSPEFREEVLDKVPEWTYSPATQGQQAVSWHGYRLQVAYLMPYDDKNRSSHDPFRNKYNEARELIAAKKSAEAAAILESLFSKPINLYELSLAKALLAKANYAQQKWQLALRNIRHATFAHDGDLGEFLNRGMRRPALRLRVVLEAQDGNYRDALCSYLKLIGLPEVDREASGAVSAARAEKAAADVLARVTDPKPLNIPAEIYSDQTGGPMWTHPLLRAKFSFAEVTGKVDRFKLLCPLHRVDAAVEVGKEWSVPADVGPCTLYVSGEPGAKFRLIESN